MAFSPDRPQGRGRLIATDRALYHVARRFHTSAPVLQISGDRNARLIGFDQVSGDVQGMLVCSC